MLIALKAAGFDQPVILSGLLLFRIAYYLLPLLVGLFVGSEMFTQNSPLVARLRTRLARHPLFGLLGLPALLLADFGTRILAVLTFGAGALLLASAAIPSVIEHIENVRAHQPILIVEGSSWFSILTGVLLLGLARGIDGRLRVAYRVTMWLLLISAGLAVTKGLHFGEALFLLSVAVLLRARKRVFTRRAMTLSSATTLGWYAGLLICVLVFFAIGVAQVLGDDSFDLFYFGFGEHTSRVGRGLAAAVLGLVIYLIWQFFAVKRPALTLPNRHALEQAQALYAAHGGGEFAHLTFMRDKHLFWAADHQAVVAFGSIRNRLVALGSPCGPEAAIDRAILDFRRFADAQDRVPVFYEVLEPDLSRYHDHGFDLFKLGELAIVNLREEFSLAGKRWEDLRQAVNRAGKEQLTFEIVNPPHDSVVLAEVKEVSDTWLAYKGSAEKGFSLGHFDADYFAWSPLALVRRSGELIAFANVLPPYGPNGTASVDLMRHIGDAPRSTMDYPVRQCHALGAGSRGTRPSVSAWLRCRASATTSTHASTSVLLRSPSVTAAVYTITKVYADTRTSSNPSGPGPTLPTRAAPGCRACSSISPPSLRAATENFCPADNRYGLFQLAMRLATLTVPMPVAKSQPVRVE